MEVFNDLSEIYTSSNGLAACIGVSQRHINQLAREGVIEKGRNGRIRLIDAIKKYCNLIKSTEREEDDVQARYWEEKALHEKAKRELAEISLGKMQGKIYDAKVVELVMTEMLSNLRTQLNGLPSKLSPRLAGKGKTEIYEMLTAEITEKIGEISDYKPDLFSEEIEEKDE